MQTAIRRAIRHRVAKLRRRAAAQAAKEAEYRDKFTKRTGLPAGLPSESSSSAKFHKQFETGYCGRNANALSKMVWRKALQQSYQPVPAILYRIPKSNGKYREIMSFGIVDASMANVLHERLNRRNIKRQSGNSFAYRSDRNQFDAIIALRLAITRDKVYIIQFDFKAYFDNIPHAYINSILDDPLRVSITEVEKSIVKSFLTHRYSLSDRYDSGHFKQKSVTGTPQGSSLSLFLANLANDDLDKSLESINGRFVRYADDVVAVANTYDDAVEIEKCFIRHCVKSGLKINYEKSPGIRVLSDHENSEIKSLKYFKFLGYNFSSTGCEISETAIRRIKTKISNLINIYLIYYPKTQNFNKSRVGQGFDWDLLGLVTELRGYLYGGATEDSVRKLIYAGMRIDEMRGLMSYYALIDNVAPLKNLDGWLVNCLRRALAKRAKILKKYGVAYPAFTNSALISGAWYDQANNSPDFSPDARLPSFVRGWRGARKYYLTFGLEGVKPPPYLAY